MIPLSSLAAIKWRFNAWAKYPNWQRDEKIGSLMAKSSQAEEIRPVVRQQRVVLEGGSIDVNGQGTLLTTEECLLSKTQQRNPGMKRDDYEKTFAQERSLPRTLTEASEWLEKSQAARELFGDAFVEHFAASREWEDREFRRGITDWELARYFEII